MKLKRQAAEPGHKTDEVVTQEYLIDLAERFVKAFEKIAETLRWKEFK